MTGTPQPINRDTAPMTIGDWIITLILLYIPIVGLVCMLYWALSSSGNVNRKNFSIAALIITIVAGALVVVAMLFFGGLAAVMSDHGANL
jgi:hypothetical protein